MDSPIDEIKNRLNVVDVVKDYVKLDKAGINYRGLCPFHSEKTPSFFVSPARQIWHCFGGCGEGGDIFKFVMRVEGIEFGDALRLLASKAGVALRAQGPEAMAWKTERQRLYEICELALGFFEKQFDLEPKEYLSKRGMAEESMKEWRLGYAPKTWSGLVDFLSGKGYRKEEILKTGLAVKKEGTENYYDRFRGRIIFPVFDFNSRPIGFGGRIFKGGDNDAKYLNTPATLLYDKSKVLYGMNKSRVDIRKHDFFVLVEGYTDVIMSHQAGVKNVIATSGTALTNYQLDILKRYSDNAFIGFDMDAAGDSATKRGIDLAREKEFNIKIIMLPSGEDPADLVARNSEEWGERIKDAKSIVQFYFENAFSKNDCLNPEGKRKIGQSLVPVIGSIHNEIEKDFWIKELSRKLSVSEEAVLAEIAKKSGKEGVGRNEMVQEEVKSAKKGRREMIEERILVILSANKELISAVSEFKDFFSESNRMILEEIIGGSAKTETSADEKINLLGMRAEVELEGVDTKEELEDCLRELKAIEIKTTMGRLAEKIKSAETKGDDIKSQKLKEEFNSLAQRMSF